MDSRYQEYLPWLALKNVPGVGNYLYKRLIDRFGAPDAVFNAGKNELKSIKGITLKAVNGIISCRSFSCKSFDRAKAELDIIQKSCFNIVTMNDPLYPCLLKHIPDPPAFLTCIGDLDNVFPCISIVGSRKASSYGLGVARELSCDLASKGFRIVSGMARGIDSAAHKGALKVKGKTTAVLGTGLGRIYPRENRKLFYDIADHGAVISEFNVNTGPEARNFPVRNRIISGISTGTIVVEAAARSGSLITARLSAEYGREVFAVPGSIHSFKSMGTHDLLKHGAKLVENYRDVIEELSHMVHFENFCNIPLNSDIPNKGHETELNSAAVPRKSCTDKYQRAILKIMEPYPQHIDMIIEKSGMDAGGISAALLDMELKGIIKQSPGKLFYIIET